MTTTPKNAKSAALEALIEARTQELHLPTVRHRFRPLAVEAAREQQTPLAYLAALLARGSERPAQLPLFELSERLRDIERPQPSLGDYDALLQLGGGR